MTNILDRAVLQFCRAIKISLAVVADVKDGEKLDGLDDEIDIATPSENSKAIVNPSALGANGIFSSVNCFTLEEEARRLTSQRIVVGSWLLTKETCLALGALISQPGYSCDVEILYEAGMLVVNTLTSLKHTGAAFAAHKGLQSIAESCFRVDCDSRAGLPERWATRMLEVISESEKIRDSTLRRSLGYSLGFLSLQRAEISTQTPPRRLCRHLVINLLKMSLPPRAEIQVFFTNIELDKSLIERMFSLSSRNETVLLLDDQSFERRSRVHSLNVLRHLLLDAPLSQEIFPFVGLAIMSAVIGYTDNEWSVRNSSTLVFAAAMLRSIDSDKNATNKDSTCSNAISLHEIVQAYPFLPSFLLAVLKGGIRGVVHEEGGLSLPPILPILLLLARVQSVSKSGKESAALAEPFVPVVLQCIQHRHLIIRKAAARALANLASDGSLSEWSLTTILEHCQSKVTKCVDDRGKGDHWNLLHGSLLSIHELTMNFEKAATNVKEIETQLFQIVTVYQHGSTILVPPPCISVAINILEKVLSVAQNEALLDVCFGVITWVDRQVGRPMDSIGAAELSTTAAAVAAKCLSNCIWDAFSSASEMHLERLKSLVNSGIFDIRLAAVKAFKKNIYQGLERCSMRGTTNMAVKVMTMLLQALEIEILRGKDALKSIGSHPPTLRRLSRCLLVVISTISDLVQEHSQKLTVVARSILDTSQELSTMLDGNGLELLSFAMSTCQNGGESRLLLTNLIRMSDPCCEWRVRHSAAAALQNCQLFSASIDDPITLFRCWTRLMHDDDFDVRNSAARALPPLGNDLLRSGSSEIILIQRFSNACDIIPEDQILTILLLDVYNPSKDLNEKLNALVSEFSRSQVGSTGTLLNTEPRTKIFQEENPNCYHEESFSCPHAAIEITRRASCSRGSGFNTIVSQIFSQTHAVLGAIQCQDLLHDVTRHNTVFAPLHSLLLSAICCVVLLQEKSCCNDDSESVQRIATDFVGKKNENGFSLMHPCIVQAITALAAAKSHGRESTIEALQKCCFLLPQNLDS